MCNTNILSQQTWANNYSWTLPAYLTNRTDISVYLFVVMKIALSPALLFDGQKVKVDWRNLASGGYTSDLCGAVIKIDPHYHNVSLNQSAGNFSVYLLISGPGLSTCTSLGHVASQNTDTDYGDWELCGNQEIKSGFDPPTTTTEAQTTAATTESASSDWTANGSDVTTHALTTTTSAASHQVNCSTCWAIQNATLLNLTKEELDSLVGAIKAHLYVNPKVTSAYKRTLECAPDYRPVSNSIGIAGIIFCALVTLCVVASDLPLLISRFTKCGTS